jgi:hypothetical protein
LFADLPGAPRIPAADRQGQANADALIAAYGWADQWSVGGGSVAFVKDVPAGEAIRRLGGDPAACSLVDAVGSGELVFRHLVEVDVPGRWSRVGRRGCWWDGRRGCWWDGRLSGGELAAGPRGDRRALSRGGPLASTFAGGDGMITVQVFRDGPFVRRTEPIYDPGFEGGGWGRRWWRSAGAASAIPTRQPAAWRSVWR